METLLRTKVGRFTLDGCHYTGTGRRGSAVRRDTGIRFSVSRKSWQSIRVYAVQEEGDRLLANGNPLATGTGRCRGERRLDPYVQQ